MILTALCNITLRMFVTLGNRKEVSRWRHRAVLYREDVFRVSLREKSKRLRNALIGLAIGAGAGVAAAEISVRTVQPIGRFRGEYRSIAYAVLVPVGLGVGAGIGAAFPDHQTIYRAK